MNPLLRAAVPCLLAVAAIGLSERDAHALGSVDIEGGARVGAGTNPDSKGPNPFGLGLGGRAGVSIFHVYLGVSAIHYFGATGDVSGPGPTGLSQTVSLSYSSTLVGGEFGYSITGIPLLTLRPQIGIGNAAFSLGDASQNHLYIEPGLVALISVPILYFGADVNVLAIPNIDQGNNVTTTYTSFTIHGQIGFWL